MKIRKLVCPFLSLFILFGCSNYDLNENKNPKQEVGESIHNIAYKEKHVESIVYPKTNIKILDQEIEKTVDAYQQRFMKQLKDYKEQRKADFNINYESYVKDERYVSIKLAIYEHIHKGKEYIETFVYDMEKGKFISLFDVYEIEHFQSLSNQAISYFKERYPQECDNDQFRSHVSAAQENYQYFVLKKDRMVFYFPAGTLFQRTVTYDVMYQDIQENTQLVAESEPTYVPYDQVLNEPVKNIDPNKPMIAITFDDGPSKRYTAAILDSLKENQANATFFILGASAANAPQLLQRMILEGNEIGNHTFSHKQLTTLSKENIEEEISATQESIYNITHYYPDIIRPPYGSKNQKVMESVLGKKIVTWSIDTRDWIEKDAKVIVDHVLKSVKDGDIILMHDLYASTAQATAILIPQLQERGFQLVTVSELYMYGKQKPGKIFETKKD